MGIIEEFVQHYKKEHDFYEMVSKLVAQQMESSLHEAGIRAIVTYRAKNPERLLAKLYQRNEERDSNIRVWMIFIQIFAICQEFVWHCTFQKTVIKLEI